MMDTSKETNKNECFKLILNQYENNTIEIDHLKYPSQDNCILNGPTILKKLVEFARELQYNIYVVLDFSTLILSNPGKTEVDMAAFKILLDGESFYNKHGFRSDQYDSEITHNEQLRQSPIRDTEHNISDATIETIENNLNMKINDNTTFIEVANVIKSKIQNRQYSDEAARAIEVLVTHFKGLIHYNRHSLHYKEKFH